jgi:hypothetical protein
LDLPFRMNIEPMPQDWLCQILAGTWC